MLVRLSLDETHGVGRLRHDVVRGGGVAYMRTYNTPSTLNSLSLSLGLLVLLWYSLVCTTLDSGTTLDDMMT